jgi:hypothetical protein
MSSSIYKGGSVFAVIVENSRKMTPRSRDISGFPVVLSPSLISTVLAHSPCPTARRSPRCASTVCRPGPAAECGGFCFSCRRWNRAVGSEPEIEAAYAELIADGDGSAEVGFCRGRGVRCAPRRDERLFVVGAVIGHWRVSCATRQERAFPVAVSSSLNHRVAISTSMAGSSRSLGRSGPGPLF